MPAVDAVENQVTWNHNFLGAASAAPFQFLGGRNTLQAEAPGASRCAPGASACRSIQRIWERLLVPVLVREDAAHQIQQALRALLLQIGIHRLIGVERLE